jgi:hypothetical protein
MMMLMKFNEVHEVIEGKERERERETESEREKNEVGEVGL